MTRAIGPDEAPPCAFLDRDGVLNVDIGYPHRPDQLVWIPGAREAVRILKERGYRVVVVSNQSGVARGYFDETAVQGFHDEMNRQLFAIGAQIDQFYYCPFHSSGAVARYVAPDHPWRKPNPGMILQACADHPVDLTRSFLVGDKPSDIEAAERAGIPGHLFTGGDLDVFLRSILPD